MGRTTTKTLDPTLRYEYRVWGRFRSAKKRLKALSDDAVREQFDDCYLLVDDPRFNAKLRGGDLKVKRLVGVKRGFEQWASHRYSDPDEAPAPFAGLLEELDLADADVGGAEAVDMVAGLGVPDVPTPVLVSKTRRRFWIGSLKAELTDLDIEGGADLPRTLAIEGADLDELATLRRSLGMKGLDNVAMHIAIDEAV